MNTNELPRIEDYSYSAIADLVQKDKAIGKKAIIQLVKVLTVINSEVRRAQEDLNRLTSEQDQLKKAIHYVVQNLEMGLPLSIAVDDEYIITITENGIKTEFNVL